jgi:hypothetical protein
MGVIGASQGKVVYMEGLPGHLPTQVKLFGRGVEEFDRIRKNDVNLRRDITFFKVIITENKFL